jgi:hypothetical protein
LLLNSVSPSPFQSWVGGAPYNRSDILKLENLIIKWLEKKRDRPLRKGTKRFSPSSFGKCFRRQYWQRECVDPTNDVDIKVKEMAAMGNLCEYLFFLKEPGGNQQVLIEDKNFKGYCDREIGSHVEEVKSVTGDAFRKIAKPDFDLVGEKLSNGLQCMFYASKLFVPGVLVYVSRDSLEIEDCIMEDDKIIFKFNKDSLKVCKKQLGEEWEKLLEYELETLVTAWENKKLPIAKPRKDGECGQCQYQTKCIEYTGGNEDGREDANNRGKWVW